MKKIITLSVAIITANFLMAQPPKGPADAGMIFGEKVEPMELFQQMT